MYYRFQMVHDPYNQKENTMSQFVPQRNSGINHAIQFATMAHGSQVRKGNAHIPYIFHPIDVANEVIYYSQLPIANIEVASIVAVLHDVVEDTAVSTQAIADQFGSEIAEAVLYLSKDESVSKAEQLKDNLARLGRAPRYVQVVKLADRISNLKAFPAMWDRDRIGRYLDDSVTIASHLGGASEMLYARLLSRIADNRVKLSLFAV